MGFSRQEYWSEQPFPSLGDLPDPGIEPATLIVTWPKTKQKEWEMRFLLTGPFTLLKTTTRSSGNVVSKPSY